MNAHFIIDLIGGWFFRRTPKRRLSVSNPTARTFDIAGPVLAGVGQYELGKDHAAPIEKVARRKSKALR